jgi:hypothetical protein
VIGWFADLVQHPGEKCGTALALRGRQGVGKTIVGKIVGSLLGEHYVAVSDPRYVTGRFNSHLVSALLLHADEGFWAGDHAAEGKIKDLVTGDFHFVEFKGREPIKIRNYVRLLVTGNPAWLVPAGMEERRFAVLDVGEDRMQDHRYFAAIEKQMAAGGRAALLDYLLKFDLSRVNLRQIPRTAALLDQKIASLSPEMSWLLDFLRAGQLPWGCDGEHDHCLDVGAARAAGPIDFGMGGDDRERPDVGVTFSGDEPAQPDEVTEQLLDVEVVPVHRGLHRAVAGNPVRTWRPEVAG